MSARAAETPHRRVLLTGVGGPAGRSLAAQLHARGHVVIGTDMLDVAVAGAGVVVPVPPATDPGLVGALVGAAIEHGVDLVIATVSEELPLIARARSRFPAPVVIGAPAAVELAHDKLLTAQALDSSVPLPRWGRVGDFSGVDEALATMGGPFVVKPRISRGGRGVRVIRQADDLKWAELGDESILQEFAPGTEYAPVVFRDGHSPDLVVVLEKLGLASGEVGNATAVRRVAADADLDVADAALAAVRGLGLTGPVDVDVRRARDGQPVVLEVNARFGANSAAAPELLDRVLAGYPVALPVP